MICLIFILFNKLFFLTISEQIFYIMRKFNNSCMKNSMLIDEKSRKNILNKMMQKFLQVNFFPHLNLNLTAQ